MYSFLYTYLHHHEDTEDAMQTVYLKVKRNIDKYKAGTNARAWLLQIAKNHALNEIKKANRTIYTDNLDWVEDTAVTESEGVFDVVKRKLSEEDLDKIEDMLGDKIDGCKDARDRFEQAISNAEQTARDYLESKKEEMREHFGHGGHQAPPAPRGE